MANGYRTGGGGGLSAGLHEGATTTNATESEREDVMYPLISFEINELRRRELRVEAARARLAAEAKRAGRRRSNIDWLGRVASRWQRLRTAPAAPAVMTPTAPARTPGTRQVRGRVRRARETHATTSARG